MNPIDFITHPIRTLDIVLRHRPFSISGVALNHAWRGEVVKSLIYSSIYYSDDYQIKYLAGEEIELGQAFYSCACGRVYVAMNPLPKPRWIWQSRCPHFTSLT